MVQITYHNLDSDGQTDEFDSVFIALYITDNVNSNYLDNAFDFVKNALGRAYSTSHIAGWEVSKRSISGWSPDCASAEDGSDPIINQWDDFRDDWGGYLITDGIHVLMHACNDDGKIALGTFGGDNPWTTDMGAVDSTQQNNRPKNEVSRTCVHESLHGLCRSALCSYVDDMTKNGDEHTLGVLKSCGSSCDATTPFARSSSAGEGECDKKSASSADRNTWKLSECEMNGMSYTAYHVAGYHNH